MKPRLLFLLILLCPVLAFGQVSDEIDAYLREFPQRAAFNAHCYEFLPIKDTPAPGGFKPFYISHYGRHGTRSDSDGTRYPKLRDSLRVAKAAGILTTDGDSLLRVTDRIIALHNEMPGRLTPRGAIEHSRLAERMYHRFPGVFRKGEVHALSSVVPRCLVSMNAFTSSLKACNNKLVFTWDCGEKYQYFISRSYPKDMKEEASRLTAESTKFPYDTAAVYAKLFTDPQLGRKIISPNRLVNYIFKVASFAQAHEIDENCFSFLPWDAVVTLYCRRALNAYLWNCNSVPFGDRRMPRAKPLAEEIIRKADEAIAGAPVAADLIFGHDWPFLGICSYFGLEGYGYPRYTAEDAVLNWNGTFLCPFAANLQIVFYRNRKGDILVKFLTNERETLIPELEAFSGPYYRWEDVKAYISRR